MKFILQRFFIFTFFAVSPAWAHSICQYQQDEAQCHGYPECVWTRGANGSGQCVYEKGFPKKISCELTYTKRAAKGDTSEFKRGVEVIVTEAGVTSENNGFKLDAKLEHRCSSGTCYGYSLHATISKGVSSSLLVYSNRSVKSDSVSTGLEVANELGFVNCFIENDQF